MLAGCSAWKWDLSCYEAYRALEPEAMKRQYPIALFKYGWVAHQIALECQPREKSLIADVGCGRGEMKMMSGESLQARWVGIDSAPEVDRLERLGYESFLEIDSSQRIALKEGCFDLLINRTLHHALDPLQAIRESYRVLKSDGVLLLCVPIFSSVVLPWLKNRYKAGAPIPIFQEPMNHAFGVGEVARLLLEAGFFRIEKVVGGYFWECEGSVLEDSPAWAYFNQLFGALFPAWGGELYVMARK